MVPHWNMSDSKSPQVSRTLLCILAVLSNAVIWIVSTRPPNSKSSRPFYNPHNWYNRHFHVPQLFQLSSKVTFFRFYSVVSWDSKVDNFANSLFYLIIIRSGLLAEIKWSVCISFSHQCKLISFHWSPTDNKSPQVSRTILSILVESQH